MSPFSGRTRTTLLAGLAWYVIGFFVNGLTPWCLGVAGLTTVLSFSRPGMMTTPGPLLPSCWATIALSESRAEAACFLFRPLFLARAATNSDLLIEGVYSEIIKTAGELDHGLPNRYQARFYRS